MKLAEFNDLCWREWGKPRRGDVVSLSLTGPGAAELAADVLTQPQAASCLVLMDEEEAERIRAGARVSGAVNPVTRTVVKVKVKPDGPRETARVAVMGGTYRETWWAASA